MSKVPLTEFYEVEEEEEEEEELVVEAFQLILQDWMSRAYKQMLYLRLRLRAV